MPEEVSSFKVLPRLSLEPGFFTVDLRGRTHLDVPIYSGGLLGFIHVDENAETVIKILLCDDLAKEFLANRPFCGRANLAAYRIFAAPSGAERIEALAERLKAYEQLAEKYNPPQTSLPIFEPMFTAGPQR